MLNIGLKSEQSKIWKPKQNNEQNKTRRGKQNKQN